MQRLAQLKLGSTTAALPFRQTNKCAGGIPFEHPKSPTLLWSPSHTWRPRGLCAARRLGPEPEPAPWRPKLGSAFAAWRFFGEHLSAFDPWKRERRGRTTRANKFSEPYVTYDRTMPEDWATERFNLCRVKVQDAEWEHTCQFFVGRDLKKSEKVVTAWEFHVGVVDFCFPATVARKSLWFWACELMKEPEDQKQVCQAQLWLRNQPSQRLAHRPLWKMLERVLTERRDT